MMRYVMDHRLGLVTFGNYFNKVPFLLLIDYATNPDLVSRLVFLVAFYVRLFPCLSEVLGGCDSMVTKQNISHPGR